MHTLSKDIARCDGLLPKGTIMPDGSPAVLWSIDCPMRETCARYTQQETGNSFGVHFHQPEDACPDYIKEKP